MSNYSLFIFMTEKKENILAIALNLFAKQGYEATPTSQIAKVAGVSEGLIFRHFENKEGLLNAILEEGQARLKPYIEEIVLKKSAKKRIAMTIDLAPNLIKNEREFWALQFALKFKNTAIAKKKQQQTDFIQLFGAGVEAFTKLKYKNPLQETQLLMLLLEGLTSQMLAMGDAADFSATVDFIKQKYKV